MSLYVNAARAARGGAGPHPATVWMVALGIRGEKLGKTREQLRKQGKLRKAKEKLRNRSGS